MKKQTYKAISRICLNNWHYIDKRVLSFHEEINFFTGHSGSGKSTVIDALQIVLYANTDGRGFFNKAAADDSDRSLIEYLRGMVNIEDNNQVSYLRNKNFSTTIVVELENTSTKEKECVGVVFDVETATNNVNRMFFWHKGALIDKQYRWEDRAMAVAEVREYLQRNFQSTEQFYSSNNERFRRQLYDTYLGGLDVDKFPRLFKRAIPFRMNIKLEDFVKEYICMEQDIQINDMQESVMQYGRMRKRIEDTLEEVKDLQKIKEVFEQFEKVKLQGEEFSYFIKKLEILKIKDRIIELQDRIKTGEEESLKQFAGKKELEQRMEVIGAEYKEVLGHIANSGYSQLETQLQAANEIIEHLGASELKWNHIKSHLKGWRDQEITPNQVLWDIEKFEKRTVTEEDLIRLKHSLEEIKGEVEEERHDVTAKLRALKLEEGDLSEEVKVLKKGEKGYPKALEEARYELRKALKEKTGTFVNVQILADLLEVKSEEWQNAVEGFLGRNKLALIVEPNYVKEAMEVYQGMQKKQFHGISIVDTKKVLKEKHQVLDQALAHEVKAKEPYVEAFVHLLLGRVIKCDSIESLREVKVGITKECLLYQNYQLRRINPENYTTKAYIGEISLRARMKRLEEKRKKISAEISQLEDSLRDITLVLNQEYLKLDVDEYLVLLENIEQIKKKTKEKDELTQKMQKLQDESIEELKLQEQRLEERRKMVEKELDKLKENIWQTNENKQSYKAEILADEEMLQNLTREFPQNTSYENRFITFMEQKQTMTHDAIKSKLWKRMNQIVTEKEGMYAELVEVRSLYLKKYPNRTFSSSVSDNKEYNILLEAMQCEELEVFKAQAKIQAKAAVEHFKDDFIYKIRSAIREAYQRRDELNRIIERLDFGKDKYQFKIAKNKGADGKFYKMFMDDSLQIDPMSLAESMDDQMDLFSMEHENRYGDMMNELINIFIPKENASIEELEEAKRNMDKYSDYRTYLSFDMEQIIQGDEKLTIGLSKMIKKNSGGEGQNPLYVALLASFAQAYKINIPVKNQKNPTIRLVVLDEAFSKMDAEKVASCIKLIRGLGFQAVISATNDKIQNYLENVDKTFVYANPNKKNIAIQEFERTEFTQLADQVVEIRNT